MSKNNISKALDQPMPKFGWIQGINLIRVLQDEKYRIQIALDHSSNNTQAMELLNMPETTFYRKLKKYKLKRHEK